MPGLYRRIHNSFHLPRAHEMEGVKYRTFYRETGGGETPAPDKKKQKRRGGEAHSSALVPVEETGKKRCNTQYNRPARKRKEKTFSLYTPFSFFSKSLWHIPHSHSSSRRRRKTVKGRWATHTFKRYRGLSTPPHSHDNVKNKKDKDSHVDALSIRGEGWNCIPRRYVLLAYLLGYVYRGGGWREEGGCRNAGGSVFFLVSMDSVG